MLQVAGAEESSVEGDKDTEEERAVIDSQECLLSSSDDGSEGMEKFLRDKLDSFGGEGLDKIVEVDPAVVLELLDDNLMGRGSTGKNVVGGDEEMSRNRVDDILCSGLQEKEIGGRSKRPLCDVDVGVADERPSKSVNLMMQVVDGLLEDVNWLVCQMLGSHSQVAPDQMTPTMVHRSWNRFHESELMM